LKQRHVERLRAADMKFMRRPPEYSLLDLGRSEDIFDPREGEGKGISTVET
jgi:hypothetical protein